jgi:hypothetical protein
LRHLLNLENNVIHLVLFVKDFLCYNLPDSRSRAPTIRAINGEVFVGV